MKGVIALSSTASPPQVGDLIELHILLEGTLDGAGPWKFKEKGPWFPSGSFTVRGGSIQEIPSDSSNTKLSLEALVHQAGALQTEEMILVHEPSGREITILPAKLTEARQLEASEENPPWTLPAIPIGGLNYFFLALLAAALLALIWFLVKKFRSRMPRLKKLNHKDKALQSLQALQKSVKVKKGIKQEEWKKFSFELAGVLRRYSDENFLLDSSDLTDREFLAELKHRPKAAAQIEAISSILSTIDEVRYGKKELDVNLVPVLLEKARVFVEKTFDSGEEKGK